MARPRKHDRSALLKTICLAIAGGALVKDACAEHGITAGQLREWTAADPVLSALYARAREEQAHALAEQAIAIAHGDDDLTIAREEAVEAEAERLEEEGDTQRYQKIRALQAGIISRDKLRVDALKWMASKIAPRTYGERIQQEVSGTVESTERHYVILGGQKVAF